MAIQNENRTVLTPPPAPVKRKAYSRHQEDPLTPPKVARVISSRDLFGEPRAPQNHSILSPLRNLHTPPEREIQNPFVKEILQIQKQTEDEGFIPFVGPSGLYMTLWINPEKTMIRKIPNISGQKNPSRKIFQRNLKTEESRCFFAQQIMDVAKTEFKGLFYDQEYITYPLPQQGNAIPDFILQELLKLASAFYAKGRLVDINPGNFRCRQEGEGVVFFDFGLGLENESVENEEGGSENYHEHIIATFFCYLNDWEKLYPGTRIAFMNAFIEKHPESRVTFEMAETERQEEINRKNNVRVIFNQVVFPT